MAAAIERMRKRDGRVVRFDPEKIALAINKAFIATYKPDQEETARKLSEEVVALLEVEGAEIPDVEHVQDMVERVLMDSGYVQTAKAYILYRNERSRAREMNSRLMKVYEDITFSESAESDVKRENANINADTAMGSMLKYGSEGAKQFYQMFVLKPEHAKAHREGDIHIHDLDFYTLTTTCCQIDIQKLFDGGFSTGHGHLREPNDIASYSALACIAIQSNQNDQHGGQSIVNFDYGMAAGVAKTFERRYTQNLAKCLTLLLDLPEDPEPALKQLRETILKEAGLRPRLGDSEAYQAQELTALRERCGDACCLEKAQRRALEYAQRETDRATYQAMEAFIHNLNTMHSRAGAQTPFSSINYGMDTSAEGRMVMRNLLLATEAGLGSGETPIFPIQIFRVKDGVNFNPGEPNYDLFQLACRCSAKRLFPNFAFIDALQPPILRPRPPGDGDCLHGLPHPGHQQRPRPQPPAVQQPRQPELHLPEPPPHRHQGQRGYRGLLRRAGPEDGPVHRPAPPPSAYPEPEEGVQLPLPHGPGRLAGQRQAPVER